ncbi:MAG: ATP-binding protein [Nitrospirota bacterium]|nr:ATP-binding protein [Nitrospirota bacterium]
MGKRLKDMPGLQPGTGIHLLTLRFFDAGLERDFHDFYFASSLKRLRYAIALGFFLYAVFGILDSWAIPEAKYKAWFIRYAIVCPQIAAFFIFSFSPRFKKYMQPLSALTILAAGLGIVAMTAFANSSMVYAYYAGLILVIMFALLLNLGFLHAAFASWTIVCAYEITALWINPIPLQVFVINNFFFISACIVAMFAGYMMEFSVRKDFLQMKIIEDTALALASENARRRLAEEELQTAKESLESRVRERTAELSALNEQLCHSQKMEAVGLLAGGIAHDFSNILTTMKGCAYILRNKLKHDPHLLHYAQQILSSSDKANGLTQSLLAFSRKQIITSKPVHVNAVIERVKKLLSRLIGEDIALTVEHPAGDLTIKADSSQLEQLLMNLATNARDAMPDGGDVSITAAAVEVDEEFIREHGYGQPGRYLLITFTDSGRGMNDVTVERIFEPFFTTKDPGKGTGLGLSIVYGIVKQHGGHITVRSMPDEGTAFRIYFPLIEPSENDVPSEPQPAPRGGSETILIAEDDRNVRSIVGEVLRDAGYKTIEAADGEEAVRLFIENWKRLDMVLLDVIMPRKNGREVYYEIKSICPEKTVLFTSGYIADVMDRDELLGEGMHFISKSATPEELLAKIRKLLDSLVEGTNP